MVPVVKTNMPVDQVRMYNPSGWYIQARGENGRAISNAVVIVLLCIAIYWLSKIK